MSNSGCKVAQVAPVGRHYRVSSESAWPLKRVDGTTWAKAKEQEREACKKQLELFR